MIIYRMHVAWVAFVGGRLKSDYQYSPGINYNPFPWPNVSPKTQVELERFGQAVISARDGSKDATLADLYDPDVMPAALRKAHEALDLSVDRLYRTARFGSDRERVEHLFSLYEKQTAPLAAKSAVRRKRVSLGTRRARP